MTGISKVFYEISAGKSCSEFHHPEIESCLLHTLNLLWTLFPGGLKLYIPLLIIPPILKGRQLTWKYLKKHIWEYIDLSFKTYVQAVAALTSICVFYRIFGKLHFYTTMALPGMVSALMAPKMIHSHLRLQSITFFNMMLEVLVKKSELKIVKVLRNSKKFTTFTFMILSGIIMNVLQKGNLAQFWLISPAKVKKNENTKYCSHGENSCLNYLKDGIIKYTILGLILEVSRQCISLISILFKNPFQFLANVVTRLKFRLTLFLACYVGIFRISSCLLCLFKKKDSPEHSKIAGFLSGIAFFIYPQYQIYTLAFTKCMEMSWIYAVEKMKPSSNLCRFMKRVQNMPILWFMRFCSLGVMYHTALFYPHLSPAFNHKAFNFCSNDAVKKMKSSLISWMLEKGN